MDFHILGDRGVAGLVYHQVVTSAGDAVELEIARHAGEHRGHHTAGNRMQLDLRAVNGAVGGAIANHAGDRKSAAPSDAALIGLLRGERQGEHQRGQQKQRNGGNPDGKSAHKALLWPPVYSFHVQSGNVALLLVSGGYWRRLGDGSGSPAARVFQAEGEGSSSTVCRYFAGSECHPSWD